MAELTELSDAGPCRCCQCGQWDHKRGKGGCKQCGVCAKYEPPKAGPVVESDPASPVPGVVEERPDGPDLGVCVGGPLPAEPGDVDLPVRRRRRRGPSGTVVATDPAAQAESLRLVAAVDAQLGKPGPTVAGGMTAAHDDLRRHLYTRHHNLAALGLSDADARDDHAHEHRGPGTIRNHDPADLSYDPYRPDAQLAEPEPTADVAEQLRADLAEERREHQATAQLLAEQRQIAERATAELTATLRELGRERAKLRAARERVGELERTLARQLDGPAAEAGPGRVLWQYDARQCLDCGFRTTVEDLDHEHPLVPVTVLVVARETP